MLVAFSLKYETLFSIDIVENWRQESEIQQRLVQALYVRAVSCQKNERHKGRSLQIVLQCKIDVAADVAVWFKVNDV